MALAGDPAGLRGRAKVTGPHWLELGSWIVAAAHGLDACDATVHLALGLGLRREEALGLRWSDV